MTDRPADESVFLRAIREKPVEETNWLVYADWLDERSDPRAEVLRIFAVIGLIQNIEFYPDLKARLETLRPSIDPQWLDEIARLRELQFRPYEHVGRPTESDIEKMWQDCEVTWVGRRLTEYPPVVEELLIAFPKTAAHGLGCFAQFTLSAHPVLEWFGSRNRWQELQFFPRFVQFRSVHESLFTRKPRKPKPGPKLVEMLAEPIRDDECEYAMTGAAFPDQIASAFGGSNPTHRTLGRRFGEALFGDRLSEVHLVHSTARWADWFERGGWPGADNHTWLLIDPPNRSVSVLCLTAVDD